MRGRATKSATLRCRSRVSARRRMHPRPSENASAIDVEAYYSVTRGAIRYYPFMMRALMRHVVRERLTTSRSLHERARPICRRKYRATSSRSRSFRRVALMPDGTHPSQYNQRPCMATPRPSVGACKGRVTLQRSPNMGGEPSPENRAFLKLGN